MMLLLAAAHRDPEAFDRPDEFDPDRESHPALGFWQGSALLPGCAAGSAGGVRRAVGGDGAVPDTPGLPASRLQAERDAARAGVAPRRPLAPCAPSVALTATGRARTTGEDRVAPCQGADRRAGRRTARDRRHAGYAARPRPAAGVPARARRARGLDRSAGLRRAARGPHRTVLAAGCSLPVGLLRSARAGAAGLRRRYRVHARRLPSLRAAARATGAARDDDRRDAAGCRRLVLPVAARGWHDRRVAPRGRRSRPAARRRGVRRLPTNVRARRGHRHALHVDEIDILVRSTDAPLALPGGDAPPTDADKAIARHAVDFIPSGATLQTGIGSIPNQIATCWPTATAATTGCAARCSPTAACSCIARARSPTPARASTTV